MALAEVHSPGGQLLASFSRRDEDRAWRTVQTQATTEHSLEEGGTESRRRWPTGTRVTMDGQPWATLIPAGWSRTGVAAAAPPGPARAPDEVNSDY